MLNFITEDDMYEKFGEFELVKNWTDERLFDKFDHVWTMVDSDDGEFPVIVSGLHFVNRLDYYLSELPVPDGEEYIVE